jgi:hypothetical protein
MQKMSDELSNENFMEAAASEVMREAETEEVQIDEVNDNGFSVDLTDEDLEIPESDFFKDSDSEEFGLAEENEVLNQETEQEIDIPPISETIKTYKADGKEYQVDFSKAEDVERAIKALSMERGARKTFSEKARLSKELEKGREERKELARYKKNWDELDKLKDDPGKILESLTGKKFEDFKRELVEQHVKYESASDEERKVMDYEAHLKTIEANEKRRQTDYDKQKADIARQKEEIELAEAKGLMTPVFKQYSNFEEQGHTSEMANTLREMLWQSTTKKLSDLEHKGYNIKDPTIIKKVFANRAKALTGNAQRVAEKKVDEIIEHKKETAKKAAGLASTRSYPQSGMDMNKLVGRNPLDVFRILKGAS